MDDDDGRVTRLIGEIEDVGQKVCLIRDQWQEAENLIQELQLFQLEAKNCSSIISIVNSVPLALPGLTGYISRCLYRCFNHAMNNTKAAIRCLESEQNIMRRWVITTNFRKRISNTSNPIVLPEQSEQDEKIAIAIGSVYAALLSLEHPSNAALSHVNSKLLNELNELGCIVDDGIAASKACTTALHRLTSVLCSAVG